MLRAGLSPTDIRARDADPGSREKVRVGVPRRGVPANCGVGIDVEAVDVPGDDVVGDTHAADPVALDSIIAIARGSVPMDPRCRHGNVNSVDAIAGRSVPDNRASIGPDAVIAVPVRRVVADDHSGPPTERVDMDAIMVVVTDGIAFDETASDS